MKTRKPIAKIKQQKNEHLPTEQNINSTIKYTKNKITNQIQPKPTKTIQKKKRRKRNWEVDKKQIYYNFLKQKVNNNIKTKKKCKYK